MTVDDPHEIAIRLSALERRQTDHAVCAVGVGENGPETLDRRIEDNAGMKMDGVWFHVRCLAETYRVAAFPLSRRLKNIIRAA